MHLNCLIIFVKNQIPGRVKTRLAAEIGEDSAMHIYQRLLAHTQQAVAALDCDIRIYYSHYVDDAGAWKDAPGSGYVQEGGHLGDRMSHAIAETLRVSDRVILIGSDSPDISPAIIRDAFIALQYTDLVIGPARDGGYYLIGMQTAYPEVFIDIPWSTSEVFQLTRQRLLDLELNFAVLETCTDIDTLDDAVRVGWIPA